MPGASQEPTMPRQLLALVTALVLVPAAAAEPWPQWRGPNRDGHSAERGLLDHWKEAPPLVWKAEGLGNGYAGAVVQGGVVCTLGGRKGKTFVIALADKDGKELWATAIDEGA